MPLDKYQVMNAILQARQTVPWSEVYDSIDGQRINVLKEVWVQNPEYVKQENLGVAESYMRDNEGKPVRRFFHYVVWNKDASFAMSPLGGFMEPQIVELTGLLGDSAFPFSCEIERVDATQKGQSDAYRILQGSIGEPVILPELAAIIAPVVADGAPQSLEDFAEAHA